MNTLRASGATSESMLTTLTPFCGGLLERRGDRVRVVAGDDDRVRLLLDGGVDERDLRRGAGVGRAEMRFEPPSSFIASSTPECSNSSYGLPSCFGIETVLRPCLELGARDRRRSTSRTALRRAARRRSSSFVSPQAATASTRPARARRTAHAARGRASTSWTLLRVLDVERRRRASVTRRARFGPSTEPTRRAPVTIWIQYDEMDSLSSSAFWMPPSSSSARMTPTIVPRPPKIETPPSSTAVIAVSSKPWPTFAAAVELRSVMTMPASAATAPETHEEDQLDPLDAQAGEVRRLLVGADRVDRAPERRRVQHHAEGDGEDRRTARSCSG